MSNIIIGGDFVPTKSNLDLFLDGKSKELIGNELYSIISESEYTIFNLEVPLVDKSQPISKFGPSLIAPEASIKMYSNLNIDLLTLANNHILDQGGQGLHSTIRVLEEHNISHVGVGEDVDSSSEPFVFQFGGYRIGVYACAEHEFSIATAHSAGANPFDPLWSLDHVSKLKDTVDYVIVLYHGGKEHYRYPSPNLQKNCRRLVDKGADLVVCQHSHCIGCIEEYLSSTIVYGQGNFLFDGSDSEYWKTSILIAIDKNLRIDYIPIVKNGCGVRLAGKEEADGIMSELCKRSELIKSEEFVAETYKKYSEEVIGAYLYLLSGKKPLIFRALNRVLNNNPRNWINSIKYGYRQKLAIRNILECEAHRELVLEALKGADIT